MDENNFKRSPQGLCEGKESPKKWNSSIPTPKFSDFISAKLPVMFLLQNPTKSGFSAEDAQKSEICICLETLRLKQPFKTWKPNCRTTVSFLIGRC